MKKIICFLFAVVLCFSALSACTKPNTQNNTTIAATTAVTTAGTTTEAVTTTDNSSYQPFAPYKSYLLGSNSEDVLNDNPIDKSFLAEESKQITTVDNVEFLDKYYKIWDTELSFTLKNLRVTLKGKALKALNDSQSAWQKFRVSDVNLGYEVNFAINGVGSIIPILDGYKGIALIRERTLELKEYYYMATGDLTFKYH